MDEVARAWWVKLALRGEGTAQGWRECIVCGAPTKLTYACQQTPDSTMEPGVPPPEASPSGRNCWIERGLHMHTVERDRLIDRRNGREAERDTG